MANGYSAEEALEFCTEYLNLQAYTKRHVWDTEEEQGMKALVVEGHGRVHNMSGQKLDRAHQYVIVHHGSTSDMRR